MTYLFAEGSDGFTSARDIRLAGFYVGAVAREGGGSGQMNRREETW
jgi:hypothetical protein